MHFPEPALVKQVDDQLELVQAFEMATSGW